MGWFRLSTCSKGLANYNSLFYLWHQCYSRKPAHGLHIMNRCIIRTEEKSLSACASVRWEDCASIQPPPPNVPQRFAPHHPWSINTQSCSPHRSFSLGLSIYGKGGRSPSSFFPFFSLFRPSALPAVRSFFFLPLFVQWKVCAEHAGMFQLCPYSLSFCCCKWCLIKRPFLPLASEQLLSTLHNITSVVVEEWLVIHFPACPVLPAASVFSNLQATAVLLCQVGAFRTAVLLVWCFVLHLVLSAEAAPDDVLLNVFSFYASVLANSRGCHPIRLNAISQEHSITFTRMRGWTGWTWSEVKVIYKTSVISLCFNWFIFLEYKCQKAASLPCMCFLIYYSKGARKTHLPATGIDRNNRLHFYPPLMLPVEILELTKNSIDGSICAWVLLSLNPELSGCVRASVCVC